MATDEKRRKETMERKESTIRLLVLVLLASLVVLPLVAPLAGSQSRVGVVFADEGDEDGDEDEDDGDTPGKIAIYWLGSNIYGAGDRDAAAQDVLDRGFTHVFNNPFLLDLNRDAWLSSKGFKVIQDISATKYPLDITPRYSSPYEEPQAYADRLANLEDHLLSRADYLVGILDDIELYPWPTRIYEDNGDELLYPKKETIANAPNDYKNRIGTEDAGTSWRTFKDHPSDGYHDVENLTIENIEYNFPMLSTSHEAWNSRLNLGYFKPGEQQVVKIAQTFRPEHDRITRIDILVARHGDGAPGFPRGYISFYLTEITDDGMPDESENGRLFPVDLRIKATETDYDAGTEFEEIAPLSLYFDPEEHGLLDTTKTYALVLWFRGQGSDWWYVLASDDTNSYSEGESFRFMGGENWDPFGSDIWFKVYYPDPPSGWGLRQFHEDWIDFQTDVMKWHVEEYRGILDRVNASKGTSLELYVYSAYSGVLRDWTDRVTGNLHGDYTGTTFYSVDWDKLASAGLDYAIAGYGQQDISMTLADLAGRAELIGGAQNQEDWNDRWWQCNKKAVLWYLGTYDEHDPRVVVPRGRSPKSIP
jgi:hypothetical protein